MSDDGFKPDVQSVFGGLCTYVKRSQLATGMSPACHDVEFRPGVVQSRPGNNLLFTKDSFVNSLEEFVGPDAIRRIMLLDNLGNLIDWKPPDTTQGATFSTPLAEGAHSVPIEFLGTELTLNGSVLFGRFFFVTPKLDPLNSGPKDFPRPQDSPWQYDPADASAFGLASSPDNPPPTVTLQITEGTGGTIPGGERMFFYVFEDRYGNWTSPSPVVIINLTAGATVSFRLYPDAPTIPSRVSNVLVFTTVAGGKDFYNLPQLTSKTAGTSDAVTFTDTDLLNSGTPYDAFRTQVRPPIAAGLTRFADRLVAFGTYSVFWPYLAVSLAEPEPLYGSTYWSAGAGITNFDAAKVNDGVTNVRCATFATFGTANNYVQFDAGSGNVLEVRRVRVYNTSGALKFNDGILGLYWSDDGSSFTAAVPWPYSSTLVLNNMNFRDMVYPAGAHRYWRITPLSGVAPLDISEIQLLPTPWGEVVGPIDQDFDDETMGAWTLVATGAGVINFRSLGVNIAARYGVKNNVLTFQGQTPTVMDSGDIKQYFVNNHNSSFQSVQPYIPAGVRPALLVRVANIDKSNTAGLRVTLKGVQTGNTYVNGIIYAYISAGTNSPIMAQTSDWQTLIFAGSADVDVTDDAFVIEFIGGDGITKLASGKNVYVDYFRIIDSRRQFDGDTAWFSEFGNPALFDRVRSPLPISDGDGDQLRFMFEQSGNCYAVKENSIWVTSDRGTDPNTWTVDNVTLEMGTPSYHGVALGPDFAIIAHSTGVYKFTGGRPEKISQEIENLWRETINTREAFRIWVSVDSNEQVVRIGLPQIGGADVTSCTTVFRCDYSEGWDSAVSQGGVGRKWSYDTVPTRDGGFVQIAPAKKRTLLVGGSSSNNSLLDDTTGAYGQFSSTPPGLWDNDSTVTPTVTVGAPSSDPFGRLPAFIVSARTPQPVQWAYAGGVPQRAIWDSGVGVSMGSYYFVNLWIYHATGGGVITFKNNIGVPDQNVVTNIGWTRYTRRFGPATTGVGKAVIWLDFGAAAVTYSLWGWQVTFGSGLFWTGYSNYIDGAGVPSGFVVTPALLADKGYADSDVLRSDWNQAIPALYETAPYGQPIGRSTFGRVGLRMAGSGQLLARWHLPTNLYRTFKASTQSELPMADPPTNDLELQDNYNQTQLGLELSTNTDGYYWSLSRLAVFSKPSTYDEFRR